MECPNCRYLVAPGEMPQEGVCPNCNRPFRGQPTPLESEMAMRNMPAPGETDMGGNPLQEGIYAETDGGWQPRKKRDESFASVRQSAPLFPPCQACNQVAGFEPYPFARGYLQCKNCGHLETTEDLAGQYNTQSLDLMAMPETEHPLGPHTGRDQISMEPYEDWRYAADEPEFETEGVIGPGGQTVQVKPFTARPDIGWHNGNAAPLQQLGVKINGEDPMSFANRAPDSGHQEYTLSHDDPQVLDVARQIAEAGGTSPDLSQPFRHALNRHRDNIEIPEVNDQLHNALGFFDVDVAHPESGDFSPYRQVHQELRPNLRGPVQVGAKDPQILEGLRQLIQGDPSALMQYKNRMAKTAWNMNPGDAADGVWNAAKDAGSFAWDHPEIAGAAAGLALTPLTGGLINPMTGAMIGSGIGTGVGMGKDMLEGAPAAAQGGGLFQRGPGALAHTAGAAAHPFEPSVSQLDPNGEAADLFQDMFPLILHYATSDESALHHPWLKHLDDKINEELGQHKAQLGLALRGAAGLAAKALGRGAATEGAEAVAQAPMGAAPAAASGGGWMSRAKNLATLGGMGAMNTAAPAMDMVIPGSGDLASGLMTGAMVPGKFGPIGKAVGFQVGQEMSQNNAQDQMQAQMPEPIQPPRSPMQLSHREADYEHPSSIPEIGTQAESPEGVDPHEINDGDENPAYDPTLESGVGAGNPDQASPQEGAHSLLAAMLPLLLRYYNSEQSGDNDPLLHMADAVFERDLPGYQSPMSSKLTPLQAYNDDHEMIRPAAVTSTVPPGAAPAAPMGQTPQMNPGHVPNPQQQSGAPGTQRQCSRCGANIPADSPTCPQCQASATNIPAMMHGAGLALDWNDSEIQRQFVDEVKSRIAAGEPVPQSDFSSAKCHNCGAILPPGGAFMCPNCNMPAMGGGAVPPVQQQAQPVHARTAHQGPHTNEQYAAVAEYLESVGRGDEVPVMLEQPWQYAEEMAMIQRKGFTPDDEQQQDPMPPQEEAPPEDTMPVPGMSVPQQQMASAIDKYATPDSYAPRCPKCNSGSTGILGEDGTIQCHACGNQWKKPLVKDLTTSKWKIKVLGDLHHHHENAPGVPAADHERPEDLEREQDSSLSWADDSGEPLKVGREYEMHSANYDIPDIVRIEAVKPDSIEYTLTGEYGLEGRTEVTREEADIEQLSFSPSGEEYDTDVPPDANTMDDYERNDPSQVSDLSVPAIRQTKKAEYEENPAYHDDVGYAFGGGAALDNHREEMYERHLMGDHDDGLGHYEHCPECEQIAAQAGPVQGKVAYPEPPPDQFGSPQDFGNVHQMGPGTAHPDVNTPCAQCQGHGCANCQGTGIEPGQAQSPQQGGFSDTDPLALPGGLDLHAKKAHLEWLNEEAPDTVPEEWEKTAGKNYTPLEQREFIDEQGQARNQDKLNLAGTHYEEDDEDFGSDDLLFY